MKTLNAVVKVLAAIAALAGAIYLIAVYGDRIVAWAKKMMGCCPWDEGEEAPVEEENPAEETPAEEPPCEEAPVEEAPVEEAPAAPVADDTPVADEEDFEG